MPEVTGVALDAARENGRPPRDNLVRAMRGGVQVRAAATPAQDAPSANANGMPTLYGNFGVFDQWTEIDSWYEGNFMERVAMGAYKKTFREITPKVLFQHGGDPQVGDKILGAPEVLREDAAGPYAEVPLLDTSYNRDLVPGLEAGLYGASFRFSVMREDWVQDPGVSASNPKGLPERTIKELRCAEFGPVTFPAYAGASMGVRSMTDEFLIGRATERPEHLKEVLRYLEQRESPTVQRMDSEDVGTLACMLKAASDYIEEQDEADPVEVANIAKMQGVQATLIELLNNEAVENEPLEDEENSAVPSGETRTDEAAEAVITQAEAGAPGKPTPLWFGSSKAAPGNRPTPLYSGKSKKNRKGWAL